MTVTAFDELAFFRAIADSGARALLIGPRLTSAQRAEIEAWENTPLSPEDFEARVGAPWTEREREDFDDLVRWFRTRYPTAGERLRAIRNRVLQLRQRTTPVDR